MMAEADQVARPRFFRALAFLLLNLPLGTAAFSTLIALASLGFSMLVILVGLPLLAGTVLLARGAAQLERTRVHSMLGTHIPAPYPPPGEGGQLQRWLAPLKDAATWRDLLYVVVLFPLGIIQFSVVVAFWSLSLALLALPVFYRYTDDGAYHFPSTSWHWVTVDSVWDALPWAAAGVVCCFLSVVLTRAMAAAHARFARSLLGPASEPRRAAPGLLGAR